MSDDPELVFDVQRVTVPDGRNGLFALTCRAPVSQSAIARIHDAWALAWLPTGIAAPGLLILDNGMKLSAVSNADLEPLGLMRIPKV